MFRRGGLATTSKAGTNKFKNEHTVNSAFHLQQSIDFPLHGCYTASRHLEKQEYLLYLKDYDLNAHTGHRP